jgi:cystathionine beta-lyase
MNDLEIKSLINEYKTGLWNTYKSFDEIGRYSRNRCNHKREKIFFAVDNTFATPYLQKPLDLELIS